MTHQDEPTQILISSQAARRLAQSVSRRTFLAMTGGTAAAALLAACGSSSKTDSASTESGSTGSGATETSATGAGSDSVDKNINMFTWAEYDDPDLLKRWGNIKLTIFNSNDEAIQKLAQAKGSSGFDIIVPTGIFVPQMVKAGLLKKLDKSKLPNFSNLDAPYTNQSWDPGNVYSVCKDWGSVGWIYDTTIVKTPIKTWTDFMATAQGVASGKTSLLDVSTDVNGMYFWANGIDWTTEKPEDLDAAEAYLVDTIAPHIKAFDSYPGINLASDNYALSMVFNGDARQGLLAVKAAGKDPSRYVWGLGSPATEIWMDNWCILEESKNPDGAHDFINFILDPANSVQDLQFHGYNTGIKGVEALAGDLPFKDMVFLTPEQVATMKSGAVNTAQDRLVEILSKMKAKAGK
jgi:spermidine/putrescine transport system substrate-binding protein